MQLAAWDGVKQQLTYLRLLGDCATAELHVEKAEGDVVSIPSVNNVLENSTLAWRRWTWHLVMMHMAPRPCFSPSMLLNNIIKNASLLSSLKRHFL